MDFWKDKEVSQAILIRFEAVLSRCKDEQNLWEPGTESMKTKRSARLSSVSITDESKTMRRLQFEVQKETTKVSFVGG